MVDYSSKFRSNLDGHIAIDFFVSNQNTKLAYPSTTYSFISNLIRN